MKFDENLAAVHAYLCADGYVVKNPEKQKHKYYHIGFRNKNLTLLKDFQKKFEKIFCIRPYLIEGQRCRVGSKEIYEKLINEFGSFYSYEWKMPQLDKDLIKIWLRTYFDCEGWVFCKSHQNRHIGVDCVNKNGILQVKSSLNNLGIKTIIKHNRNMYRIFIYSKKNLLKFKNEIGFLHPEKLKKLDESINDYMKYGWIYPKDEKKCKEFIINLLKNKIRIKKPYYVRIISKEKENLDQLKKLLKKFYSIESLVYKRVNGLGAIYFELDINKKSEIQKLINLKLIPNILENV